VHELSLCHSIQGIVDRARGGRDVLAVHLQIGELRQVVPETLAYCWELVTDGGPLAGSQLRIDHVPVVLLCASCDAETAVEHSLVMICAVCGSRDTRPVQGEEFLVTTIDLAAANGAQPTFKEA
jgi:hydrogenase nickel incorporation protein HypA/HybF